MKAVDGVLTRIEQIGYLVIRQKRVSAAGLASSLDVSVPTASRIVAALRKKGVDVRSRRRNGTWHYFVGNERAIARARWARFRRLGLKGFIRRSKAARGRSEDDIIHGETRAPA